MEDPHIKEVEPPITSKELGEEGLESVELIKDAAARSLSDNVRLFEYLIN